MRYMHWNNLSYQYWQRSKIPTFHFQKSLPRLPIPQLELTCDRYLAAQKPLLGGDVLKRVEVKANELKTTTGVELQKLLVADDKKNKHTSYISEPWFNTYLKDRKPLPINYNPVLVFLNDNKPEYNDQVIRATNLVVSSLRFYKSLHDNVLEPEVYHMNPAKSDTPLFRSLCSLAPSSISWYAAYLHNAYPLDMSQYYNLFNSTRLPKRDKDVIYSKKARHITVQFRGNFYMFNVLDESKYILPADIIYANFKKIVESAEPVCEHPLGVLTTLERNTWGSLRDHFVSIGNQDTVDLVDSALFNVCLDENSVGDDPVTLCRSFLHGDGKNRWFDKSISLLLSRDGVAGVNFEHSWGDGVAVLRFFQDIHKDSIDNPQVHPDTIPKTDETSVQKLEFIVDDRMKSAIVQASKDYESTYKSLEIDVLQMDGLGKNLCKKHRLSPDAIMQLGFQVAQHKLKGNFVASYESCSTAAFKHGRTETIRPCTMATKSYCLAANSTSPPSESGLLQLIINCSKTHGQLTKEAAMGQGFDRHLFALRLIAQNSNLKLPALFEDPTYDALNYNIISTSTLSSPSVWAGGFGPVVKDGYGIAYSIRDDSLGVLVTSYPPHASGKDYVEALQKSYKEMMKVLQNK